MSGNIKSRNMLCIAAIGVVVIAASRLLAGWFVSHSPLYNSSQQAAQVASPAPAVRALPSQPGRLVQFNPKDYKGPTGRIGVPKDGNTYRLYLRPLSGGNEIVLDAKVGEITAPVGRYRVTSYRISSIKKPGCEIMCYQKSAEIEVKQAATTELKVAAPYTAKINVASTGNRVDMSLQITDSSGNDCRAISRKVPGFQVLSQSGEKVWEGTFTFG